MSVHSCRVCPKQGIVFRFLSACAIACKKAFQVSCSCQWRCLSQTMVWECWFRFTLYPTMLLPHCLSPSTDNSCLIVSLNGTIRTEFWFFSNHLSSFSAMQILTSSTCVVAWCGTMCLSFPLLCYLKRKKKRGEKKTPLNLAVIGWTGEADFWTPAVAQTASLF